MNPKILFLSTGLDRDHRGFESHIRDLFERISLHDHWNCFVLKGGGQSKGREIRIHTTLPRKSRWGIRLGRWVSRSGYDIQNFSFFLGCIPYLLIHKPDVLYLGDPPLQRWLHRWRSFSGQRFNIIFFTGGNAIPLKIDRGDFLQLVSATLYDAAIQRGVAAGQMSVLPHFVEDTMMELPSQSKEAIRKDLHLPTDRLIILSVGAVDSSVKRMDYVISEVSKLVAPVFLLILGEYELETDTLRQSALQKLGSDNFKIGKVTRNELPRFYQAADIFVLASLNEGFGLVTIEALAQGLPVLVHPHPVAREVLGEMGVYDDFRVEGNLARLIEKTSPTISDPAQVIARREYVSSRFSWAVLAEKYDAMFQQALRPSPDQPFHT